MTVVKLVLWKVYFIIVWNFLANRWSSSEIYKHRPNMDDIEKNEITKKLVIGEFSRSHDQYKDLMSQFFELNVNYLTLNRNFNFNLFIFRSSFKSSIQNKFELSSLSELFTNFYSIKFELKIIYDELESGTKPNQILSNCG